LVGDSRSVFVDAPSGTVLQSGAFALSDRRVLRWGKAREERSERAKRTSHRSGAGHRGPASDGV